MFCDGSLLRPNQAMVQSRRRASDLYQRTKSQSASGNLKPYEGYRAASPAMLSGAESIAEATSLESSNLVGAVEDYVYASM